MTPSQTVLALIGLYQLYLPIIGVVVALVQVGRLGKPRPRGSVVETWLRNYMLFAVGLSFLVNFFYHTVFASFSARLIGWANSPFQIEVGTASLGMALAGFLAVTVRTFPVRLAAWLATAPFLWGAAVGHIIDIVRTGNSAAGNAGFVLYLDIIIPAVGLLLLWLARRHPIAEEDRPHPRRGIDTDAPASEPVRTGGEALGSSRTEV